MQVMLLEATDRDFFNRVAAAAAANPFGHARSELVLSITDLPDPGGTDPAFAEDVAGRIEARLSALRQHQRLRFSAYGDSDRLILESAAAFAGFYRFRTLFDELIEAQARAGSAPCQVGFAEDFFRWLKHWDVSHQRGVRLMALFYQLRRASRFIARGLVGGSSPMRALRESLWNNLFTSDVRRYEQFLWGRMEDFSTILLGETGTGKGEAAAALGRAGLIPYEDKKERFALSFTGLLTPINLSQYSESLIESELFGHHKGAFTGAVETHAGAFSRCSEYGTIFLDEVGEVGVPVQIKLLRVLQERTFSPVGSHEELRFSGRVVAATHRPLTELRMQGRFRDDFYYRLCSDTIRVPSLSERIADNPHELADLVSAILERILGGPVVSLAAVVTQSIAEGVGIDYAWPGNVRELEQSVRRVLLIGHPHVAATRGSIIEPPQWVLDAVAGSLSANDLVAQYCASLYDKHGSYETVARIAGLDRRTAKKYVSAVE